MTLAAARSIADAIDHLESDPKLMAGVLTGAGGTFCAGMDLKRFQLGERPHIEGRGFGGLVESPPTKPLVAAVEGWALGGGFELVLACDLIVAGSSARFGLPEVKRGLVARGGGAFRISQVLPRSIALEILLTGEPLTAQLAYTYGFVNRIVGDGLALSEAVRMAELIAKNAPLSVRASKVLARNAKNWNDTDAFVRQEEYTDPVFASADAREGAAAFTERRAPKWSNC